MGYLEMVVWRWDFLIGKERDAHVYDWWSLQCFIDSDKSRGNQCNDPGGVYQCHSAGNNI